MTHRAESVMDALVARLTGLGLTGSRVYRGRVYNLQASEFPALTISMGGDVPELLQSQTLMDSELSVSITAWVKSPTAQIDESLTAIREQVTVAMQSDYTLGLPYVVTCNEGAAQAPELDGEGSQPVGSQSQTWTIRYRRSRTDPGA